MIKNKCCGAGRRAALILLAAAAVGLSGCGETTETYLSSERPVDAMRSAANFGDEEGYLSCWLPQEKAHFRMAEDREKGFLGNVFRRTDHDSRIRLKIRSNTELGSEELAELMEDAHKRYGTHPEFTRASRLSVEFRVQDEMDILSDSRDIIVVRYGGTWYIYGDVIDSFTFAHS